jgi:hypothetical protein
VLKDTWNWRLRSFNHIHHHRHHYHHNHRCCITALTHFPPLASSSRFFWNWHLPRELSTKILYAFIVFPSYGGLPLQHPKVFTYVQVFSPTLSFHTLLFIKIAVLWNTMQCSVVKMYQRFRGTCCLLHQGRWPSVGLHRVTSHEINIIALLWGLRIPVCPLYYSLDVGLWDQVLHPYSHTTLVIVIVML